MRPFRLARIALTAELLRLRHFAERLACRIVLAVIALMLLLGALTFGHVALWLWMGSFMPAHLVALVFAGFDFLLALVLALMAMRSSPGQAEREARSVREQALEDAVDSVSISSLLVRLVDLVLSSRARR